MRLSPFSRGPPPICEEEFCQSHNYLPRNKKLYEYIIIEKLF